MSEIVAYSGGSLDGQIRDEEFAGRRQRIPVATGHMLEITGFEVYEYAGTNGLGVRSYRYDRFEEANER